MQKKIDIGNCIIGMDVSTKTIGVALFTEFGDLIELTHISPKAKPKPETKIEELFKKADLFSEFIQRYSDLKIKKIIIEEPLLGSNNSYTVGVLLRFNGMISKIAFDVFGIVPEFISTYDARQYAFPELLEIRKFNRKGEEIPNSKQRKDKVLFGNYSLDVDKKLVIFEKVNEIEPNIKWLYTRNETLRKENFDMTDAFTAVLGYMRKESQWTVINKKIEKI